jgi:pectate lyase
MKRAFFVVGLVVILLSHAAVAFESMPIGWASMSDGNVPYTITGGSTGATVTATDEATFKTYAQNDTPYVIIVPTMIVMTRGTSRTDIPQTVNLGSNKTIIGIGSNPGINGGLKINGKNNIIIRNLSIWYEDGINQGSSDPWTDGIGSEGGAHHIWIDHCNLFDSPDGLTDLTKQSNYITVSWCKYYYTADTNNTAHHYTCLIGSGDTEWGDRGKLKETFHHNWWADGCKERMPRVRFGRVHVFNNYYSSNLLSNGGYCHGVGDECQILVENNYYYNVKVPWKLYKTNIQGKIGWNGTNVFAGTSVIPTWAPNDYANIFVPPYSYTLDTGSSIMTNVQNGAGVNKLTPSPNPMTFSDAPHALDSSSIAMTATAATCADGVEYLFTCTAGGDHDSGWQTGTSYTDTGLSPSTTYTYTVQTRNQTQTIFTGAASSPASATTQGDPTPPEAPIGLTVILPGKANVPLNWNDSSEGDLAGYNVYRSETSGSGYSKLNGSLLTSSDYIDNITTHDTTYYYVVTAVDIYSNESDYSNEVFGGLYGDFTGNGLVEIADLADFLDYWLEDDCDETAGLDLDDNCIVNFYEFSVLADNWLKEE